MLTTAFCTPSFNWNCRSLFSNCMVMLVMTELLVTLMKSACTLSGRMLKVMCEVTNASRSLNLMADAHERDRKHQTVDETEKTTNHQVQRNGREYYYQNKLTN